MKTYFKDSKMNEIVSKDVPDEKRSKKRIVPEQPRFKEYDSENIVEIVTSSINNLSESSEMSLSELARKSGLSKSIISRLINGQMPTIEQAVKICNALDISVEALLRGQYGTEYKDEKFH